MKLLPLIFLIIFSPGRKRETFLPVNSVNTQKCKNCQVVIFPIPYGMPKSEDYQIKVEGKDVFCYATYRLDQLNATTYYHGRQVSAASFAQFDFNDTVNVQITPRNGLIKDFSKLVVRPISLNIKPEWDGEKLKFTLDKPMDFTIDVQGDGMNPLHFFTNTPETDIPNPGDQNIVYFGPGIHEVDQIILQSNQTLYLAGGAVLRPVSPKVPNSDLIVLGENFVRGGPLISIENADNVVIKGRGIISAARATEQQLKVQTIVANNSGNLLVNDIILMDANDWNLHIYNSNNTTVDHIRVMGYYINADGICFNCSKNGVAKNCFVYADDDSYEVKATSAGMVCTNILFENCIVWNDYASCMGVTHEVLGNINNVTWQNITITRFNPVVDNSWLLHRAAIFVHAQGGGDVSDLLFKDITIEKTDTKQSVILVDNIKLLVPGINTFPDKPYNPIENIKFSNIVGYDILTPKIVVYDESGQGLINTISFQNIVLNGGSIIPGDPRLEVTAAKNVQIIQ